MSLFLHSHPLASFCHKVLIALYENDAPFEAVHVDLGNEASRAAFLSVWPLGKMPVLRDEARNRTVPETTIIIEYLDRYYPGATALIPGDFDKAAPTDNFIIIAGIVDVADVYFHQITAAYRPLIGHQFAVFAEGLIDQGNRTIFAELVRVNH